MEQLDEVNVGVAERGVSVTLGTALIAFAAARRRPFSSLLLAAAGAWLAHRGITGRCAVYEQLDMGTAEDDEEERLDAGAHDDLLGGGRDHDRCGPWRRCTRSGAARRTSRSS